MASDQPKSVVSWIRSPPNQELFSRGEEDALSIAASRRTASRRSTQNSDNGRDLDYTLTIDEILARSGPYQAQLGQLQFRKLRLQQPTFQSKSAKVPVKISNQVRSHDNVRLPSKEPGMWTELRATQDLKSSPRVGSKSANMMKESRSIEEELKMVEDTKGRLPLHIAAADGNIKALRKCLTPKGMRFIDRKDFAGRSALYYSCAHHSRNSSWDPEVKTISCLLENGASINNGNYLHCVLRYSDMLNGATERALAALCEAGADPYAAASWTRYSDMKAQKFRITPLGLLCLMLNSRRANPGYLALFKTVLALRHQKAVACLQRKTETHSPTFLLTWSFIERVKLGDIAHEQALLSVYCTCIYYLQPSGQTLAAACKELEQQKEYGRLSKKPLAESSNLSNRVVRWRIAMTIFIKASRRDLGWEAEDLTLNDFLRGCYDLLYEEDLIDYRRPSDIDPSQRQPDDTLTSNVDDWLKKQSPSSSDTDGFTDSDDEPSSAPQRAMDTVTRGRNKHRPKSKSSSPSDLLLD